MEQNGSHLVNEHENQCPKIVSVFVCIIVCGHLSLKKDVLHNLWSFKMKNFSTKSWTCFTARCCQGFFKQDETPVPDNHQPQTPYYIPNSDLVNDLIDAGQERVEFTGEQMNSVPQTCFWKLAYPFYLKSQVAELELLVQFHLPAGQTKKATAG